MVLRGALDTYTDLPLASQAFCVIEVADSSYERDTGEKLAGYARAGVVQYIIVNLRNRTAEVYRNPDSSAGTYAKPQILSAEGTLAIQIGDADVFSIGLADLLPQA